MANRWDVTPKNGVTNIGNGVFNFSANTTTEDREYTITYYSEACNCTCEKKVIIEAAPCLCTIESSYGEDNPVGSEADESVEVGTITGCFENIQWEHTGGDNFVDNFSVDAETGKITARVSKNTGDAVRHGEYSASCNSTLTVYQAKPGECTITWLNVGTTCITCACSKDDFALNVTSLSIPNDEYNDIIGSVSNCIDKTGMELRNNTWGDEVKLEYSDDNNNIYLVVPENTGAKREETVTIAYSATCGSDVWTKNLDLSQEAGVICPASGGTTNPNDGVVVYLTPNPTVPGCAGSDGGKYAFKFDDPEFDGLNHISVDGVVVEGVSTYDISVPNFKCLDVTTTQNPSTTATRTGSITIVMNRVGGGQCSYTIPVTQRAYSSADCTTPSSHCTIDYKNETGTQIQDGIGYLYDSDGNVITTFTIHEMNAGITLHTPISENVFGSTVASAKAMVHIAGQGETLICKTVSGSIIGATLTNGQTYTFNITSETC